MNRFKIFLLIICVTPITLIGQFTISGKVVDSATNEPLAGASVYCQNSTKGTDTNKEGLFALVLKNGGYELVVSYTGYKGASASINKTDTLIFKLVKEEKKLGEVVIKSSNEVVEGWKKYGNFFIDHFIGTTPNAKQTTLKNPEVLKFFYYKKSNKLKVLATEFLQIENPVLGYNIRYQLDSFTFYYNTEISSYKGYSLYTEMIGTDSLKSSWTKQRANTYIGSKLHFMRAYYDSTLIEEGFEIAMLDEIKENKFNLISNLYDTNYYSGPDSNYSTVEIWYPRIIAINYKNKSPDPQYLKLANLPKTIATQVTYLILKDAISIKENGYYFEQADVITKGYWGWKNVADQLPFDYSLE